VKEVVNRMKKERLMEYLVVDVDGTMTDSGIYYDEKGNELKKFSTKDAAGFFAAQRVGIKTIVLTGRKCMATTSRMSELKVHYLFQEIQNKEVFLRNFMLENGIEKSQIGYIGDDLNDLRSMSLVGFVGCPSDSCKEIIEIADYVSPIKGGAGAVRDVIEHLLSESGEWEEVIADLYRVGF
jgi:3-deoxy-D-manno-octulosonate 8-phosphate phosphatase (KDO 8-P phosphatase)